MLVTVTGENLGYGSVTPGNVTVGGADCRNITNIKEKIDSEDDFESDVYNKLVICL